MDAPQHDNPEQPQPAPLRPSVALIVVSVINMIVGAVSASVALVALELLWPHSLGHISLLLLAWALLTVIAQYLGTFRQNRFGAGISLGGSALCCTLLNFSILILSVMTFDSDQTVNVENWAGKQYLVWPAIGTLAIASFWFNSRWLMKLKKQADENPTKRRLAISLREILALCVVLGLIMIPATYRAHANQSVYQADVAATDAPFAVPSAAQAITYERDRGGLLLASYEIDEVPYRAWLSRSDSEMSKHGARWHEFTTPINATSPTPDRLPWSLSYDNETVAKGFRVIWQVEGIHHEIIYDRDTKKAYYAQLLIPEQQTRDDGGGFNQSPPNHAVSLRLVDIVDHRMGDIGRAEHRLALQSGQA